MASHSRLASLDDSLPTRERVGRAVLWACRDNSEDRSRNRAGNDGPVGAQTLQPQRDTAHRGADRAKRTVRKAPHVPGSHRPVPVRQRAPPALREHTGHCTRPEFPTPVPCRHPPRRADRSGGDPLAHTTERGRTVPLHQPALAELEPQQCRPRYPRSRRQPPRMGEASARTLTRWTTLRLPGGATRMPARLGPKPEAHSLDGHVHRLPRIRPQNWPRTSTRRERRGNTARKMGSETESKGSRWQPHPRPGQSAQATVTCPRRFPDIYDLAEGQRHTPRFRNTDRAMKASHSKHDGVRKSSSPSIGRP